MSIDKISVFNDENSNTRKILQDRLITEIESRNNCKLNCTISFNTTWIKDEEATTEFRYAIVGNRMIVSRVMFKNRRSGCMTTCFEILKQFAAELGYATIVIQSVETYEMLQWCNKINF